MKTILFCIDTDVERARRQVESVTDLPFEQDQIRVVVYHVFRGKDEQADAEKLKSVTYAAENLEEAGYSVDVQQSNGDASRHILEKAEDIEADVISLAGRKRSPAGKVLFGSVTQDVILESERTVLLSSLE
ncbi:universal stress protein [Halobacterium sp. R2-5]|uniref:universal stress protein n=1 Tax=Halobacterium sp. R2-5 TaxID=2715751 RepID=UPI00141DBE27|nr:universal stress protein [Halobacterium sp. R2-5]NIC01072.1 universal stress protein [Halobacterium sp. R2-5]